MQTQAANCPACGSNDLRHEDGGERHQCRRCLWRCRIAANGMATDWLNIGTNGTTKSGRRSKAGYRGSLQPSISCPSLTD